jgi:hypothetical protein
MKTLRLDLEAVQVTTFEMAPATATLNYVAVTIPRSCDPPCEWTN